MKDIHQLRHMLMRALQDHGGTAGGSVLAAALAAHGIDLSERAVRFHLLQLDRDGFTRMVSRRMGRALTALGREELARVSTPEKLGFVAARIDHLGYRMGFDPRTGQGTVVVNLALIDRSDLARAMLHMAPVFERRLGMGTRVAIGYEGETMAGLEIPAGMAGIGTVCSVTINGVMLKRGIPTVSRYGALVRLKGGMPAHFSELIEYRGTTVDPLELLIQAGRTSVLKAAASGNGVIGVSFREIPTAALDAVQQIQRELRAWDLPVILSIGRPNQPLLEIPVGDGRTGLLVLAGLNPIAALYEAGVPVRLASLHGLEEYRRLIPFRDAVLRTRRASPLVD